MSGRWRVLLLVLWLMGVGCEQVAPVAPPTVTPLPETVALAVGASDSASRLLDVIDYVRPNLTLTHPTTSDTPLITDLDAGVLDAALIHHLPNSRDDLWFNPVALDGIVLIVHPDNVVTNLSVGEAQAMFSGVIGAWSALGGSGPVTLVSQTDGAGPRTLFNQFVLRDRRLSINAQIRPNPQSIINAVASDPSAIGYVTVGSLPADAPVRVLSVDNIAPSPTTLGTQEYALTMPLYWVSVGEPQGELRGLLGYLQSVEGQEALGVVFGRIR